MRFSTPPPGDVPDELVAFVLERREELTAAWDEMYPENPVESD